MKEFKMSIAQAKDPEHANATESRWSTTYITDLEF